jgi:NRPS condensation-like uncharacterized protein
VIREVADGFRRKLTVERFLLGLPNANVVMVALIRGRVSVEMFVRAIAGLMERHPLLRSRVELDEGGTAWLTSMGEPMPSISAASREHPGDWVEHARREFRHRFDLLEGPLVRFVLIKSPKSSEVIVNCHHAICDGVSLAILMRDLMTLLGDPTAELPGMPVPPALEGDLLPPSASGSLLARLMISRLNGRLRKSGHKFGEEEFAKLHEVFWERSNTDIVPWTIPREETSRFVSKCREEEITVTSALTAAAVAGGAKASSGRGVCENRVTVAVNLRDRLKRPVDDAFGYYASAVNFGFRYDSRHSFWWNARKVNGRLRGRLTDSRVFESQLTASLDPGLIDSFGLMEMGLLEDEMVKSIARRRMADRRASVLVSNLGRQEISFRFGGLGVEALYGPCVHSLSDKYLGAVTVGGAMHLAFTFDDRAMPRREIEGVRDAMMERLRG